MPQCQITPIYSPHRTYALPKPNRLIYEASLTRLCLLLDRIKATVLSRATFLGMLYILDILGRSGVQDPLCFIVLCSSMFVGEHFIILSGVGPQLTHLE